ncbi:MAG TPA: multidrug effflux MFS transporter [Steroidobacteraceae bacterium]|nr:multidrug effflux MFS transporter [Steroidobacteraceae bacterium]
MPSSSDPSPRSSLLPLSRGLVLLLAAMTAIGPLSIDMYLPSLGNIARSLAVPIASVQPTVAIFFVGLAAGQLVYGPLSDRLGRRGPLLFGTLVFVAGSLASASAASLPVLLCGRLAQALGACGCVVISRAVIRDALELHESARLFSLLALISGVAPICAPGIGAAVLHVAGWRGIFACLAVFGAVLTLWVWRLLPETRSPHTAERARDEHPLRGYLQLLRRRRLVGFLGAGAFNGAAMFTYIAASPTVFMDVYHLTPTRFSLLFGLNSVGLVAASQLNRWLLGRFSVAEVLRGTRVCCVGVAGWIAFAAFSGFGGLAGVAAPLFLAISTVSLVQSNALAGALASDATRAGSTAALYGASSFAAGALLAWVSGVFYDHTARPMAFTIAACFIGCALTIGWALRHESAP